MAALSTARRGVNLLPFTLQHDWECPLDEVTYTKGTTFARCPFTHVWFWIDSYGYTGDIAYSGDLSKLVAKKESPDILS